MSTESASALPEGWAGTTLEQLVPHDGLFTDGDWVESKDQDPHGEVRLIQLADVGDQTFNDKSARFLTLAKANELACSFLQQGDILVARMPDPLGRSCIFPLKGKEKFVTVVDVCIVRVDANQISNKFLSYWINSPYIRQEIDKLKSGSTRKRISRKNLSNVVFPIAPYLEQIRIVEKIEELFSELDKGVESLKTARQQLNVYRQSFLKNAVEGKLTEQWRKDNENHLSTVESVLETIKQRADARRHEQLKAWEAQVAKWESTGKLGTKPRKPPAPKPLPDINQDELDLLPTLPSTWKYQRLADVAQIGSGMSVSKGRKLENPVEVPYLRVANVQRGAIVLDEIKTMPVEESKLGDLLLEKWDVLFNEGGDRDKLGRGWVWESQIEKCITQNHVFRATTYLGGEEHSKFISHWGNSHGQAYFEQGAKQVVNLASINKTVLSMFPVPVPPLPEQKEIIQQLEVGMSSLELIEADIDQGLSRSEGLRQSILKQAFAGQLVPQDPNDESAAILLERIKKEREESEALAKKAKAAAKKKPKRKAS